MAIVLHTMAGTLAGSDSWFANPAAQVSAHFGAGDDGSLHQYVNLGDTAWANGILEPGNRWHEVTNYVGNPNGVTVSIETEDFGQASHPVSDGEYSAVFAACMLALRAYPNIGVLTSHHIISPQSRSGCCGARWVQSKRMEQLAVEVGLTLIV